MTNVLRFGLLGGHTQRLPGVVGKTAVLAMPDTGAEANIMDERYEQCIQPLDDIAFITSLEGSFDVSLSSSIPRILQLIANAALHSFAREHGFHIWKNSWCCTTLQFADGSRQNTVGQVHTDWTFTTGLRIPVTFEVLEDCCAEIVIGDSILWDHGVFEDDAYSMVDCATENDMYNLAPFDLVKNWQRRLSTMKDHIIRGKPGNTYAGCPFLIAQLTYTR